MFKINKIKFISILFLLFLTFASTEKALAGSCTGTPIFMEAIKQGWLVSTSNNRSEAYCSVREPTTNERNELLASVKDQSNECIKTINPIIDSMKSCESLNLEARLEDGVYKVYNKAIPITNQPLTPTQLPTPVSKTSTSFNWIFWIIISAGTYLGWSLFNKNKHKK